MIVLNYSWARFNVGVLPRLWVLLAPMFMFMFNYRISSNSSRASNKRRASNTGRGSEPFVPIDAGGFYSRKYGICKFVLYFILYRLQI